MMPESVIGHHFSAYTPSVELPSMTMNWMLDASVHVVDFACLIPSGIQMIHLYCSTEPSVAQVDCCYHTTKNFPPARVISVGIRVVSDEAHRL